MTTRAVLSLVIMAVVMGAILFGTAGTLAWWQGWLCLAVYLGGGGLVTLGLARRDPALLERRLKGGPAAEKLRSQQLIMACASLAFISLLVIPGLDRRFGWSSVPTALVVLGDAMILLGFYLVWLVFLENTYTSATIEVAERQRVISTGPYARVRHPMYAGAMVYVLGMPLALASWWGFAGVALLLACIVVRLLDEERFLARDLPGYEAYRRKVKYRLLPHVW